MHTLLRSLIAGLTAVSMLVMGGSASAPSTRSGGSGYAATCLAVGAFVPAPDGDPSRALEAFTEVDAAMGPLTMRRSFDRSLPDTFADSSAAGDAAAGLRSFVSWKPPDGDFRGAAAGRYDAAVVRWARSVPATGIFATAYHEPENDMTAAEFVALQRHLYRVVKGANPTIRWGPVYMAYWWDPTEPDHYVGNPADWWPGDGFADFVGVDWYAADPTPMTTSRSFRHWYTAMVPTGLPLFVVEYGQYQLGPGADRDALAERARAEAIRTDAAWIREHPRVAMWLYWQAPGASGEWQLRDAGSQRAWASVAAAGCRGTAASRHAP